jgi:hypothetical protein
MVLGVEMPGDYPAFMRNNIGNMDTWRLPSISTQRHLAIAKHLCAMILGAKIFGGY